MPDLRSLPPAPWSWSGLYFGAHIGGGLGATSFSDAAGAAIYGGEVRTPAGLAGLQLGYNWQMPNTRWVVSVEADVAATNGNGTNTCLASSGAFISANCRVRQDALASLTGRVGFAAGPVGHTLFYAKGGAAFLAERLDIAANNPLISSAVLNNDKVGWTVGAGIEQALAPAWSVKMEYGYAGLGSSTMATPASFRFVDPVVGYVPTAPGSTHVSQNAHLVRVGLNMKFGGDAYARWDGLDDYHLRGSQQAGDSTLRGEIEIGGRVWYSSGRFQKDLGNTANQGSQNVLISRLTYQSTAASGEVFGRVDGTSNLFLKGFAGGGSLFSGKMNDEDWIADDGIPYSNTLSNPIKSSIGYATVDVGYALWRGDGFKVGGFVGYNYYQENKSAYGCIQQAGAAALVCVPSIPNATLGITEDDKWHSVRLGINGVVTLAPGLKLTADAAYLPYVSFSGVDNHLLRTDVANTKSTESGTGQGVQLEAILAYAVTPAFSVGAGGRYWAMWATAAANTNIFGSSCPCQTLPARTERYGGFLEASYKFNGLK
ncbi:outer membrane beta-barrel protein [Rhodopseudomonas sp.]|uniref:outer membrane beta-barrel protein n=1 Tax=Rhodopseudomonas sp. TaxID=1078 RepID=UPI002600D4AA|nr:outer membrane beta-barrel protein [Rhodopseudomonas sp.]